MAYAELSQARLSYVIDGPADAPVLVLSNSLGTCSDMWARQIPELTKHFRVLRYDTRGHGKSSIPDGEYTFEQLAGDVAELLAHLGIKRAHFCGLSMGGPTRHRAGAGTPAARLQADPVQHRSAHRLRRRLEHANRCSG